jgi:hypothetical protein
MEALSVKFNATFQKFQDWAKSEDLSPAQLLFLCASAITSLTNGISGQKRALEVAQMPIRDFTSILAAALMEDEDNYRRHLN